MSSLEQRLLTLYDRVLARSSPSRLTRQAMLRTEIQERLREPVVCVALGKCASGMFRGLTATTRVVEALAAYPEGYRGDPFPAFVEVVEGAHPSMEEASFDAAERLVEFVERHAHSQVIVLLSGGTSASVAAPLRPWFTRRDLTHVNEVLLRSGLPIESVNTVRKHLSAIKGGRLGDRLPESSLTLVLSDVSRGAWHDVGSGPTLPDATSNRRAAEILQGLEDAECSRVAEVLLSAEVPETPKRLDHLESFLVADNETLVRIAGDEASRVGFTVSKLSEELNEDVKDVTHRLIDLVGEIDSGEWIVAGGEPTVRVAGDGRGGRCSELAVRVGDELRRSGRDDVWALLASSDGVDGRSGFAGFIVSPERYSRIHLDHGEISDALAASDSSSIVDHVSVPIAERPSGNNLRDLFLIGRS